MIVSSTDALRLTGVDPTLFRNVMERGDYTDVPPAGSGRMRWFGRDDLVCLAIFSQLSLLGSPMKAARIASEVRGILRRREDINVVHIIRSVDEAGKLMPKAVEEMRDGDVEVHTFRVAAYRRQAEKDIAAIQASKGAS